MSREIVESEAAITDVIDAADYIANRWGLDASDRFLDSVKEGYRLLAVMPGIGSMRDFGDPSLAGMRSWPVPRFRKYLIFYIATEERLKILHVLHGARNIEEMFPPADDE